MARSMTDGAMPDRNVSLDLTSLLASVGFTTFWASIISTLFKQVFLFGDGDPLTRVLFILLFTLAFVGVQLLSFTHLVNQTDTLRFGGRLAVTAAVMAVFLAVCGVFSAGFGSLPLWFTVGSWLFFGAAAGLVLPAWGSILTVLDAGQPNGHTVALSTTWSVLAATVLASFTIFTPGIVDAFAPLAFFIASVLLLLFCTQQLIEPEFIDAKTSRARLSLLSRNLIPPAFMGFTWAIALGPLFLSESASAITAIVFSSVFGAALVVALLLLVLKRVPHQSSIERWAFALLGCCLVCFALDGIAVELPLMTRFVLVAIMTAITAAYFIAHWTVLLALSYRHRVLTLYHYGQGLIAPVGGMALGWGVMCGLTATGMFTATMLSIMALLLLLALVLIPAFVPYTTNEAVETVFEASAHDAPENVHGSWQRRCRAICDERHLSPREVEVFYLLAKGRNAEHVSRTLFISTHTAKTHISRIYRKLSINSQQELIDRIDRSDRSGERMGH